MTENAGTDQADERTAAEDVADELVEEGAASESATAPSEPADELAEARALADENWSKYLRLAADMENLRKRAARDTENAR